MTFSNVKLILAREIRDQMRDRRTLFMIVVLPILLYPLLGTSFFQLAQFLQEQPTRVLIVAAQDLGDLPPLFENQQFAAQLFSDPDRARLLELHFAPDEPRGITMAKSRSARKRPATRCKRANTTRHFIFRRILPNDWVISGRRSKSAHTIREEKKLRRRQGKSLPMPKPEIIYSTANEKSQIAFARLSEVLRQWTDLIGKENLEAGGLPSRYSPAFHARIGRRGQGKRFSRRGTVGQDHAHAALALGADRRVLSGHRPLCRRKRARHAGNLAQQSCPAQRNRVGQIADDHAL